ncbi:metallophosphoesterase [Candidatus Harpocratesius sp.]
MRVAILSDLHYPAILTKQIHLDAKHGYNSTFYRNLQLSFQNFDPASISGVIINGDFVWDLTTVVPMPIKINELDLINVPIYYLIIVRQWLHPAIPLIFIKGNHDSWMNSYIYEKDNDLWIDWELYSRFLMEHYKFSKNIIQKIIKMAYDTFNLPLSMCNCIKVASNCHILQNSGIWINKTLIYGLSDNFYLRFLQNHNKALESLQSLLSSKLQPKSRSSIFLFSHFSPNYIFSIIKKIKEQYYPNLHFFWGHRHNIELGLLNDIISHDFLHSTLPEHHNFQFFFFEI